MVNKNNIGKIKIEIIDNHISNAYYLNVFSLEKTNKWYQVFKKERLEWKFVSGHALGKNYMCPEIFKGKTTIEEMFYKEVDRELKRTNIIEVHRNTVTKY
jgi:hypothetical protein